MEKMNKSTTSFQFHTRLEGKVAIITGGASGIGESAVRLFWENGAKVIMADIQDDIGLAICNQLDENVSYIHCDVSNEGDVRNLIDTAVSKYGKLDIMYNNAGIIDCVYGSIAAAEKSGLDRVIAVNLGGAFLGAKHAARVMIPEGKGCIIFTASASASIAGLSSHAYTASKHAIVGLVKSLAAELGQFGIRVNCVSPYAVATNIEAGFVEVDAETKETVMSGIGNLKGAVLKAIDIARAALYLASDEANYVSGHNLVVDGGFSVVNPSLMMLFGSRGRL